MDAVRLTETQIENLMARDGANIIVWRPPSRRMVHIRPHDDSWTFCNMPFSNSNKETWSWCDAFCLKCVQKAIR